MSEARVQIFMLGRFEIRIDGKPVFEALPQSRKALLLFQYLLLKYGETASHQELIEALWGNENSANPDMALRAITHRLRNMTDGTPLEGCIITTRGAYQWNTGINCEIDRCIVQSLLKQIQYATGEQAAEFGSRILELYTGKLLPGSMGEPWVERRSVYLHNQYRTVLLDMIEACKQPGNHARIVELCERAIPIDPYDERLYVEELMALDACGRTEEAEHLNELARSRGCLHTGASAKNLGSTYKRVMRDQRTMADDIDHVAKEIRTEDKRIAGAYLCDYQTFCSISRVQTRLYERYGLTPFLGMVTVTPPSRKADVAIMSSVMDMLEDILRKNLRQSDVIARYSSTQFVLLLCGVTNQSGINPMERVKAEFYGHLQYESYVMAYCLHNQSIENEDAEPSTPHTTKGRRGRKKRSEKTEK